MSVQTETSAPVTRARTAERAGISSTITGVSARPSTQASTVRDVSKRNSQPLLESVQNGYTGVNCDRSK